MIRFVLLIILIIAAIAGIILWKRYSPSKEQYDMKKYYGIEKDGQVGITVDNKVVEAEGKLAGGKVYVAYNIVRDYINSRFYWDPNENVLLYMLPEDMISVDVGSKDYSISKKKKNAGEWSVPLCDLLRFQLRHISVSTMKFQNLLGMALHRFLGPCLFLFHREDRTST